MPMKKLIIDSDAGIDDAGAIIMALDAHKKGEVEVLAITAVAGNAHLDDVVRNICRVMHVAKCKVPLYKGARDGLAMTYDAYRSGGMSFHGSDGFNDVAFEEQIDIGQFLDSSLTAAEAIRNIVKQHPGEVSLVPIGPLTNVALAFALEPTLPAMLREMVIMGGNCQGLGNVTPLAEFNFHADPESARVVLDRGAARCPRTVVVPWETCHFNLASREWRWEVLGQLRSPAAQLLNRLEEPWIARRQFSSMCDQKAVAVVLDADNVVRKQNRYKVSVELSGEMTRGMMTVTRPTPRHPLKQEQINVTIVEDIDLEHFKAMLIAAFEN